MTKAVLAIDMGTTNVRSMIVGDDGRVIGWDVMGQKLDYPAPGLVEFDPEWMWHCVEQTRKNAMDEARISVDDLVAIGVTGQRSSIIVWDRANGRSVAPGVSWQDQRGGPRALELLAQGFLVNAAAAASKLESVLDAIPDGRRRMARGELAWGNVDSFALWRLSGGKVHATDCSHACTTGYYDPMNNTWNPALLDFQKIDIKFFPQIVDTSGHIGSTDKHAFGGEVPITAIIGDQQSSAYAQGCLKVGECKITFGTSVTLNINTGNEIILSVLDKGIYPLVLWRRQGMMAYCLEGMVHTGGAVFAWLGRGLNLVKDVSELAGLAGSVPDSNGVFFLPSLQGDRTTDPGVSRKGVISGLTLGATKAHIIRAAMEGVCFQVRQLVDLVYETVTLPRPLYFRCDGGAAANDVLMQLQANILGSDVQCMPHLESTAYGVALLAGEAVGLWHQDKELADLRKAQRIFKPAWTAEEREEKFRQWRFMCGV